jgi:hypothetical protein
MIIVLGNVTVREGKLPQALFEAAAVEPHLTSPSR